MTGSKAKWREIEAKTEPHRNRERERETYWERENSEYQILLPEKNDF